MTTPSPTSPGFLLLRFDAFIEALCAHIAGEGLRHRVAGPLIVLIWQRIRRLAARFARLAVAPPHTPRTRQRPHRAGPPHTLPQSFGWLSRLIPGTASVAAQFRALLDTPEMTALIAANPAIGRTLRPLCHTIGFRPPPSLRRPRTKRPQPEPQTPQTTAQPAQAPPAPRPNPPPRYEIPPANAPWPRAPGAARFNPPRRKLSAKFSA
ncbi:hypothetical protein [Acidiphilium sp. C61]|uniref:hypothetical protein n=1 Tax=Acidiphilium sp. C61 TaxID=1671485 RepID=UPI00157AF02F|nr:hypothetical protein [Acidiphilium sp. C61]